MSAAESLFAHGPSRHAIQCAPLDSMLGAALSCAGALSPAQRWLVLLAEAQGYHQLTQALASADAA